MLYGSANRDPREYGETADRLDVRREVRAAPRLQQRAALLHRQPPRPAAGPRRGRGAVRRPPARHGRPGGRRTPRVGVRAGLGVAARLHGLEPHFFLRFRKAIIASRASSEPNSRALTAPPCRRPGSSMRATRSRPSSALVSRSPCGCALRELGADLGHRVVELVRRRRPG